MGQIHQIGPRLLPTKGHAMKKHETGTCEGCDAEVKDCARNRLEGVLLCGDCWEDDEDDATAGDFDSSAAGTSEETSFPYYSSEFDDSYE